MFGKGKDDLDTNDQATGLLPKARVVDLEQPSRPVESSDGVTCISSGMTIVGKMAGDGVVKIYGRIEGEVQGSSVLIYDGAQIVGDVAAQEVTVAGHVKGTIHGARVTLQGTAVVEGEISHRSLMIDENARFEGTSRRGENPNDKPSSSQAKKPQPDPQAGLMQSNGQGRQ